MNVPEVSNSSGDCRSPLPFMACRVSIRGVVQGVGLRPLCIAARHRVAGWVLNGEAGVEIHAEGRASNLSAFLDELRSSPPPAARIAHFEVCASLVPRRLARVSAARTVRSSQMILTRWVSINRVFDTYDAGFPAGIPKYHSFCWAPRAYWLATTP